MKLFHLPKPVVPNSLEMYDPVHDEKVNTTLSGMSGKISDKYTIIPQFKGNYPIKPMQFSYFDLGSRKYKTISSPEIMINVLDGPSANDQVATTTPGAAKNIISSNEQFKFIKLKTNLSSMKEDDFLGSNLFYGLLFLPFLMLPLIVLFKKKKDAIDSDVFGNSNQNEQPIGQEIFIRSQETNQQQRSVLRGVGKSDAQFLESQITHRNIGYEQKQHPAIVGFQKCQCTNHNRFHQPDGKLRIGSVCIDLEFHHPAGF